MGLDRPRRLHYTSRVWMASILCCGNIRAVSRLLRITVREIRPVAVRLLERGLWGRLR